MFYGYNPSYLITFVVIWLYSLEEQSEKVVQAYLDVLTTPDGLALENLAYSQNVDWP